MVFWTDDPVRDAEAWYAEQERQQEAWEEACVKCTICGEPIDPNFDSTCINLWGHYMHNKCVGWKLDKAELADKHKGTHAIFEMINEALEESYTDDTPVPDTY